MSESSLQKYRNKIETEQGVNQRAQNLESLEEKMGDLKGRFFVAFQMQEWASREQIGFGVTDEGDSFSGSYLYGSAMSMYSGIFQGFDYENGQLNLNCEQLLSWLDSHSCLSYKGGPHKAISGIKLSEDCQIIKDEKTALIWNNSLPEAFNGKVAASMNTSSWTRGHHYAPSSLIDNSRTSIAVVFGNISSLFHLPEQEINSSEALYKALLEKAELEPEKIVLEMTDNVLSLSGYEDFKKKLRALTGYVRKNAEFFFIGDIFNYGLQKIPGYGVHPADSREKKMEVAFGIKIPTQAERLATMDFYLSDSDQPEENETTKEYAQILNNLAQTIEKATQNDSYSNIFQFNAPVIYNYITPDVLPEIICKLYKKHEQHIYTKADSVVEAEKRIIDAVIAFGEKFVAYGKLWGGSYSREKDVEKTGIYPHKFTRQDMSWKCINIRIPTLLWVCLGQLRTDYKKQELFAELVKYNLLINRDAEHSTLEYHIYLTQRLQNIKKVGLVLMPENYQQIMKEVICEAAKDFIENSKDMIVYEVSPNKFGVRFSFMAESPVFDYLDALFIGYAADQDEYLSLTKPDWEDLVAQLRKNIDWDLRLDDNLRAAAIKRMLEPETDYTFSLNAIRLFEFNAEDDQEWFSVVQQNILLAGIKRYDWRDKDESNYAERSSYSSVFDKMRSLLNYSVKAKVGTEESLLDAVDALAFILQKTIEKTYKDKHKYIGYDLGDLIEQNNKMNIVPEDKLVAVLMKPEYQKSILYLIFIECRSRLDHKIKFYQQLADRNPEYKELIESAINK